MKIKQSNSTSPFKRNIQLIGVLSAFIIIAIYLSSPSVKSIDEKVDVKNTIGPPSDSLPNITIILSRKNYEKLKAKRDDAIGKDEINPGAGILFSNDDDLVKAKIRYKSKDYKSEIRLKGDWTQHLLGDTWSFRIKLDSEHTINGMRKFSLQHPRTRNYAGEWLFHELLKAEDILHLRYSFVNLTLKIKGGLEEETKALGVYALEEFFDKQLIEHNQRREGIIIKFDEDPIWRERHRIMNQGMKLGELNNFKLSDVHNLDILPFGKNKIVSDSNLYKQFRTARYLLNSFVDKKLTISQVFDVKRLAKYNAICNILGANHALFHHNYRFYYNPITSRLEPIGFDSDPVKKISFFLPFLHAFDDEEYSAAYMSALEEVSSEHYFNKIINSPELEKIVTLLQKSYPKYEFRKDYLEHNKIVIRALLFPEKSLSVFLEKKSNNTITTSILNHNRYPVELIGLSNLGNRKFGSPSDQVIIKPSGKKTVTFVLDDNYQYLFFKKKKGKFKLSEEIDQMQVDYRTLGTSQILHSKILEWPDSDEEIKNTDVFRQEATAHKYPFLKVDSIAKTIRCQKGHWQVSHLVIPKGFSFIVEGGTSFDFYSAFSNIISFSPIYFLGTKEEPISIYSHVRGKGLLVLNCQDTSIVSHTKFERLTSAHTEGWAVSGAVNFYKAPVKIDNSIFTKNYSEDALNIINSYFELDNVIFQDIYSDAFDGDFVEGTISNTLFKNIGNDAIDVSGSNIQISNVHIINSGDKGLSVGEKSICQANNIIIRESEIAVACKDQSIVNLTNATLEKNKLSFTAFQKKPEFGPATIIADSTSLLDNTLEYLIERRSTLRLNGQNVETIDNVVDRMYGVEFGKKSN